MTFVRSFLLSALTLCVAHFCAILLFIDAPIPAEYWVGEAIVVKRELARGLAGQRKIVVAGGSSTLFGIDAGYAGAQLGVPVINFGLHASLKLEKLLAHVSSVVEGADTVILALEPPQYGCNTKPDSFQVENTIAWDHDAWREMSHAQKAEFMLSISPGLLAQMVFAGTLARFYPAAVSKRLAARDYETTMSRFKSRAMPDKFEYSAFNLDDHGDMRRTEGARFHGQGYDPEEPRHVCDGTLSILRAFVERMKKADVNVFFANTPYLGAPANMADVLASEARFLTELSTVGCMIDRRQDLFFDRKHVFNSSLHLNNEGRHIRTDALVRDVRRQVLAGGCSH